MGYDLEITRKQECSDRSPEITPEEWLAVVQNDPELTIEGQGKPNFAHWSGPGKYPCWIDHSSGSLYSKNPTDEMIDKMVKIASLLDARVVGEEGEQYLGGGQVGVLERDGRRKIVLLKQE